ncbi:unnamed protein product [Acanthoscelides obtectus]|uniref:Progestin and adipoQ receptor family member 4 n=1 Tax=Acanthoscelides obtectus TaxID=200917 RepID=A0A9P0P8J2_ACAOB|nr:unnamed protein product [Acanthoscelides obtectus]CAK1656428.1 Progestin and adipoQ receptor family member 4 [Acanthoscelides obtectus]
MDQQSDVNTNDMSSEGPQHQEPMLTMAETQDVRARKKYSSGDNSGAAKFPDERETNNGSDNKQQCQQQTKQISEDVKGIATESKISSSDMQLLKWKDMPKHLQFNPYILTGYRPLSDAWGCVNSITYMHNETFNIVSHAIPILYILLTVPQILPWEQTELSFLAWCHIAGILCPWVGSFLYHLFMNLRRGPRTYYFLLQVDMVGIWVSQSFGKYTLRISPNQ